MKPYPEYKDSGVEWIGEIPVGWVACALKRIFGYTKGFAFKSEIFSDEGVPVVRASDIKGLTVRFGSTFIKSELKPNFPQVTLMTGDILISTVGSKPDVQESAVGQVARVPYNLDGSLLNQNTLKMIPISLSEKEISYFFYQLQSKNFRNHLDIYARGTAGQASINVGDIFQFDVIIPPIPEQTQIVSYLDTKTQQIDQLIQNKQQKIKLLQEKRTAVINQAVTKGLNPEVEMKDSGVEWIGEIPKGWKLVKLKYLVNLISGFAFKSSDYVDEGTQLIKIGNLYRSKLDLSRSPNFLPQGYINTHSAYIVKKSDLLISMTGTLGKRDYGFVARYESYKPSLLNQRVGKIVRTSDQVTDWYLENFMLSESYLSQLFRKPTGTKQGNLSSEDILSNSLFLPDLSTQEKIEKKVSQRTKQIDQLISKEQRKIELLQEYRQSLISDAVTGKIDVREVG